MRRNWSITLFGVLSSFIVTLIVVLYLQKNRLGAGEARQQVLERGDDEPARIVIEQAAPAEPDDLTRIEGIGPKSAAALQIAGITTFAQLADLDTDATRDVLRGAGVSVAVSDTWSKQAAIAAAGDWDELAAYQGNLRGGRE